MHSFRTFGTLALARDGAIVEPLGTHRKALAILTVLATDGTSSRDRLMALLWPESDTERARGSLKQAIHFLRHQLEAPDVLLGRSELSLNPERIESDVQRFCAALDGGDPLAAIRVYGGAFLDGVHLNGSAELEQWVDARRAELARRYAGALEQLAREAEIRTDAADAVQWWQRLQEHDPLDGRVALHLMQALQASGQRTAALQHARAHELAVRAELGLPPDPSVTALAERLRQTLLEVEAGELGGGGTAAVPVEPRSSGPSPAGSPPAVLPASAPASRSHSAGSRAPLAILGALGTIVLAVGAYRGLLTTAAGPLDPNLVAVAPFDALDPSLQLWGEGLMDVLTEDLDGAGPLRTVPQSVALNRWAGRADRASAARLGEQTGAGLVVFGNVVRRGPDSVGIRATVLDRARNSTEPDLEVVGEEDRIGGLADSLGVRILRSLGRSRPIGSVRHVSIGSRSLPALKQYLQGEQFYRRGLWDSALARYDRAVAEDSTFALALRRMYLARSWVAQATLPYLSHLEYLRRAVALNRGLSPRDSMLLTVDSLKEFASRAASPDELVTLLYREAGMLNELARRYPDDPEIWYLLGEHRVHTLPRLGGMPGPALDALERAHTLDPGFAPAHLHVVDLAIQLGRLDLAGRYARLHLASNPNEGGDAPSLRLASLIFDPGGVEAPAVRREIEAASEGTLMFAGDWHFRWWADSAETAVALLREVAGRRNGAGIDPLSRQQRLAAALAFRGRLRAAAGVNERLLVGETARVNTAMPSNQDPFHDLALLEVVADSVSRRIYSHGLMPEAAWSAGGLFAAPRYLQGLPWWHSRGDSVSIARFARRAGEVARAAESPKAVLRARYFGAAATAYLALARSDTAEAERLFLAIPDTLCLVGGCFHEQLTLARLLAARGEDRRAAEILDQWRMVGGTLPSTVFAVLERARVAERLGERERARECYRFVRDVWRQADRELQPHVAEARAALGRLGGVRIEGAGVALDSYQAIP